MLMHNYVVIYELCVGLRCSVYACKPCLNINLVVTDNDQTFISLVLTAGNSRYTGDSHRKWICCGG